ncbi:hypothetical protein HYQ46_003369 [Verticillium longisporum]|nr:hypothetical protein HYQ46_003369 [Verticillium longisporum]
MCAGGHRNACSVGHRAGSKVSYVKRLEEPSQAARTGRRRVDENPAKTFCRIVWELDDRCAHKVALQFRPLFEPGFLLLGAVDDDDLWVHFRNGVQGYGKVVELDGSIEGVVRHGGRWLHGRCIARLGVSYGGTMLFIWNGVPRAREAGIAISRLSVVAITQVEENVARHEPEANSSEEEDGDALQ